MTHRESWTARGAGCDELWPHTECWEPLGRELSNKTCVSSPRGGWRCVGDAPFGENKLQDLVCHSWCLLWPWGCLGGKWANCGITKSNTEWNMPNISNTAAELSGPTCCLTQACPDSDSPTDEMSPYCSSPGCPRCTTSMPLLLMVVALFNTVDKA